MNDTTPEIERMLSDRMNAFSTAERMKMMSEMFEAARKLIVSGFPPGLPPEEVRRRLFVALYGDELDPSVRPEWARPKPDHPSPQ